VRCVIVSRHPHERLDRPTLVHRPVAVHHVLEVGLEVEDSPGVDRPGKDVLHQLRQVSAHGRHTATEANVAKDDRPDRHLHIVRGPDRADYGARASDSERRGHRLTRPHALEGGVHADAIGHRHDDLGRRITALGDDVGRAELASQRVARWVAGQRDDPPGAEAPGRDRRAQADGAIAHDGHRVARLHPGADRRMVAGAHDVGECDQRAQRRA